MARIAGVDIPREKRVEVALTYIFGIGLPTSQKILAQTNINPDTRVRDLTEEQVNRLREIDRPPLQGRGRPAARGRAQHQAAHRDRLVSRPAPPAQPAGARPADQDQRAPAARTEEDGRRAAQEVRGTDQTMAERKRAVKQRRREKKNVPQGHVHIQATFNNTIITITDPVGRRDQLGLGRRRPASRARARARPTRPRCRPRAPPSRAMEHGMRQVEVYVKGPGAGREQAIRSLQAAGLEVTAITDVTPIPHNGCRAPKRRRV